LKIERVFAAIGKVTSAVHLEILIVGAREVPELFRAMTDRQNRSVAEIYLWYNLLSDVPGTEPDDLVVNWRGERSRGWDGWAEQNPEVQETFRFVCPNNPNARRKTLGQIGELLDRYPFDGIFLDKMRFPSPANGADEMLSCFCPHCHRAAAEIGLDLQAVAQRFEAWNLTDEVESASRGGIDGVSWIDDLLSQGSLIMRFLRFRCDSVTRLVAEASAEAQRRGRKVALDLFSPSLAPVVGQDYAALVRHAAWVKPMTYRIARGPASLRLEILALIDNLAVLSGTTPTHLAQWCSRNLPGFGPDTLQIVRDTGVPLKIVTQEIASAVRYMNPVPVYFGLELVRYPGSMDVTPADVIGAVRAGREAKAAGAIISWDLMHAPADGIRALGEEL
jgi:hypothetical protein